MKRHSTRRAFLRLLGMGAGIAAAVPVVEAVKVFVPAQALSAAQAQAFSVDFAWSEFPAQPPPPAFEAAARATAKAWADHIDNQALRTYQDTYNKHQSAANDRMAVRFMKTYDIASDAAPERLDVLYGIAALRQELSVVVLS